MESEQRCLLFYSSLSTDLDLDLPPRPENGKNETGSSTYSIARVPSSSFSLFIHGLTPTVNLSLRACRCSDINTNHPCPLPQQQHKQRRPLPRPLSIHTWVDPHTKTNHPCPLPKQQRKRRRRPLPRPPSSRAAGCSGGPTRRASPTRPPRRPARASAPHTTATRATSC